MIRTVDNMPCASFALPTAMDAIARQLSNSRKLFFKTICLGFLCILFCVSLGTISKSLANETRTALVVGNANYKSAPLANPVNDATAMANVLRQVGFDVTLVVDANAQDMKNAILKFGRALQGKDSIGLFYYAGHGVQVDGQNFLIPLGADITQMSEVALSGINLNELLKTMDNASSRLNIAILDACRDNPFATRNTRGAGRRGLAPVEAPSGTLIAYATGPGKVAFDGDDGNSPYTSALVKAIPSKGIVLEEVFRQTRRQVLAATQQQQVPWEHSSLTGAFFFVPGDLTVEKRDNDRFADAEIGADNLAEIQAWDRIKDTTNAAVLQRHIDTFPTGVFAELAAVKIAHLAERQRTPWSWVLTGTTAVRTPQARAEDVYEKGIAAESGAHDQVDREKALKYYKDAADLGLPAAMFRLARAYDHGFGVVRDMKKAVAWYQRAADAGNPNAMASLGTLYEFGEGVDANLVEALRLYRIAAEKGNARAMTSLGYLFAEGKGVVRDEPQARRWYQSAADKGQPRAMFNLALMLMQGRGGRSDRAAAVRWLEGAARKGHSGAMRKLAIIFDKGIGVARNSSKAAEYLLAALQTGNKDVLKDIQKKRRRWSFQTKREVQKQMAEKGLYTGLRHGFFDRRTRKALEQLAMQTNNP